MNNENYINNLSRLFLQYFESVAKNAIDLELKYRLQGYMKAGEDLSILSREQSSVIMENEHHKVFGQSISQREKKKTELKQALKTRDERYFDIPPSERI